jgi:23S rRNA pseudouridine2605 synthase
MGKPERRHHRTAGGATPHEPVRIAKALARAGLCSRREAERWIAQGRVSVNGEVLASPARDVSAGDRIEVDGKELPAPEPPRLWRYHKPRGLVTTHADPQGRKTVFDALPEHLPRVVSVGRLDVNTEGLLLLTNDGALARHLELPATGWLRRYRVRAHGTIDQAALDKLRGGVEIAGVRYGPIEATLDKVQGSNVWLTIGLREGKNREVRTILDHLGLTVNRLIRISFGPFQLLELPSGEVEPVKRRVLADQLGRQMAESLGLIEADAGSGAARRKRARQDRPAREAKG